MLTEFGNDPGPTISEKSDVEIEECSIIRCQKDASRLRLTGSTVQPMSCMIG